jgi:hypothetical protein
MKGLRIMAALSAAAICSTGLLAAAPTPVTITACIAAGTSPDTYVLLDVKEISNGHAAPAGAVYWLSTTKGLKQRVGQQVEVRGTYSVERDYGKTATMKIRTNLATGERRIALENGAKKNELKDELKPVGTSGVVSAEMKFPYRRLQVQEITPIGARCDVL